MTERRARSILLPGAMLAAVGSLICTSGCRSRPATASDCSALFDRIFALEFREAGFRDPVLEQRKHDDLAKRFGPDIQSCVGARLAWGALDCAARASSAEELTHRCLR